MEVREARRIPSPKDACRTPDRSKKQWHGLPGLGCVVVAGAARERQGERPAIPPSEEPSMPSPRGGGGAACAATPSEKLES